MPKNWTIFFFFLVLTLSPLDASNMSHELISDELVLYLIPSPHGLNWDSPKKMFFSTAKQKLTLRHVSAKRSIGHVLVELRSKSEPNSRMITGMRQTEDADEMGLVLKKGYGMGVIFADLKGRLETTEELIPQLEKRYKSGRISYIRFRISPPTFARMKRYLKEYQDRQYYRNYGGDNRPLYGEGSGCSAFGASFMETGGFLNDEFHRAWTILLRVPEHLIGGHETGKHIPVKQIITRGKRWAKENEPHWKLKFWVPDFMHRWAVRTYDDIQISQDPSILIEKRGKAKGLIIDCRQVPTPQGPIWKHEHSEKTAPFSEKFKNLHGEN